jgi:hypothetical protein
MAGEVSTPGFLVLALVKPAQYWCSWIHKYYPLHRHTLDKLFLPNSEYGLLQGEENLQKAQVAWINIVRCLVMLLLRR